MRKISLSLVIVLLFSGCRAAKKTLSADKVAIKVTMDLVNINDDKVLVAIDPGSFNTDMVSFFIPKTVPGTYSTDNYGQYIEGFKAFDYKGSELLVSKTDKNTWEISNGKNLDRISYFVNDTYDSESEQDEPVFSPAGTNILKGENFMLNLHGFVGYFENLEEVGYEIYITKPANLKATTSLKEINNNEANDVEDVFYASRYFEVTDNPILYSKANIASFKVSDITVNLSVYSPNAIYKAADLEDRMLKMMTAQKVFLGDVDSTEEYNILLYLSTLENDANGFGALEHHTSTVVVLPEQMDKERLEQAMVDVVSHEFFHIVTPLNVHSEEIKYFDFNDPKMSKHLWMYEGTTEYFANLFQIQQGLIDDTEFYKRIMEKINNAKRYNDSMSFTVMSENVLVEPYKADYANVYEKGTLINMALDITLRDLSKGEKSVLWLLKELTKRYGKDKPLKDDALFDEIVSMTYLEVNAFFNTHVIGEQPIDYPAYLAKVGLEMGSKLEQSGYFLQGQVPFIDVDAENNDAIFIREGIELNSFLTDLGVKAGDIIKSIDGAAISLESIRPIIGQSFGWTPEKEIIMVVDREGTALTLTGKVGTPTVNTKTIVPVENATEAQLALRKVWMKG
jgi:predicted metalloprotease with PDZ domain